MLTQLEVSAVGQGGAGTEQLAERKKLAEQLVIEESKHEAVEEMCCRLRRAPLPSGKEGGGGEVCRHRRRLVARFVAGRMPTAACR
jgi:hypothetical protein